MSSDEHVSTTTIELISGYEFRVKFDLEEAEDIVVDEPKPLGASKGPNASRLLATAVVNCLSASLLFCLNKWKVPVEGLKATAKTTVRRNEKGRWRIHHIDVTIHPCFPDKSHERIRRCLQQFEDYCVVTDSVRNGIPVHVSVETASDTR
ncbi:MAG: OsmC family protein [Candidatus Ranarchaeia archaeon]